MTLNILFLTITFKKRMMSAKEHQQYEMLKKLEDENRERQAHFPRIL
jgi:uncharacterized protein (TIGR02413 family)